MPHPLTYPGTHVTAQKSWAYPAAVPFSRPFPGGISVCHVSGYHTLRRGAAALLAPKVAKGCYELCARVGINLEGVAQSGESLAFTEASFKFIAPLRFGERFVVKVRVCNYSAVRGIWEHFIFKIPTQEPILEATTTAVWLDKNYLPVRIPERYFGMINCNEPN